MISSPKEKANELCLKYQRLLFINISREDPDYIHPDSRKCASIAVDEIINVVPNPSREYIYWRKVRAALK